MVRKAWRSWTLGNPRVIAPDPSRPRDAGDTLIEVLVSILILSIITLTAFIGFGTLISSSSTYRNLATMNNTLMSASTQATSELQSQSPPLYLTCATAADYQPGGSNAISFTNLPTGYTAEITQVLFWEAPIFSTQCSSVSVYSATVTGTSPNYIYSCPSGGVLSGTTCTATVYSQSEKITVTVTNTVKNISDTNSFVVNNPYTSPAPFDNTATQLIFLQQPGNVAVGQNFSPSISVEIANLKGVAITTDASTMILTVTPNTGSPGASMSSTCAGSENVGVFTFSNCNIVGTGIGNGGYTLTATDGLLTTTSNPFGVTEQLQPPVVTSTPPSPSTPGAVVLNFTGSPNAPVGQVYSAELCTDAAMTQNCVSQGVVTSGVEIDNLTPGTNYYTTVTAIGSQWFLPATSAVYGPVTTTVQLKAPVITQLSTSATNFGAIVIDYTGSSNAPPGQNYSATACTNELMTTNCVTESTYNSGSQFTGLTYGGNYYATVTATASPGYLAATSQVAGPVMAAATVPGPPTSVVAAAGNAQANVSWVPPVNDGGNPVSNYIGTAIDETTPANGGQVCSVTTTSCIVTGLTNGDTYKFSVVAINGIGSSTPGLSNSVVPSTLAAAPSGLVANAGSGRSYAASYVQTGQTPTLTYTCPSGGTLSGTTCTVTSTSTSTYVATANTGTSTSTYTASSTTTTTYSCNSGGALTGAGSTTCILQFVTTSANCASQSGSYAGSPSDVCTIYYAATATTSTTYSCPSGGSLSGTTCTVTSSYTYYTCPSGGTLSGTTCTTTSTSTSTYTATSAESYTYSCPSSNETLSGTSCITTSSYPAALTSTGGGTSYNYSCPNGGTLSGSVCYSTGTATTSPTSYPASTYPASSPISQSCPSGEVLTPSGTCSLTYQIPTVTTACPGGITYIAVPGLPNAYCTSYTPSTTTAVHYCPGGGTLNGTTCTQPATSSSYPATGTMNYTCPNGWSGSGPSCSRTFSSSQANCLNNGGSYGGGTCTKSTNASYTTTYSCGAGASLSGTTCTPPSNPVSTAISYPAPVQTQSYAPVQTYTCPAGGSLSGSECVTTNTYPSISTPNYTAVYGYICPSGGTLSGTTCNILATNPGQANIQWNLVPIANDGGSAITGYVITATDVTNSANGGQSCSVGANTSTCVISGLMGNDTYTFSAVAVNGNGSSLTPSVSNSVVPVSAPGSPTSVVATAGNGSATITWVAPTNNGGSAITGYTVVASPGGLSCTTTGATTCTVTGLTNGTTYTFAVTATNAYGNSGTTSSNAVMPTGAPTAPLGVTATPGNASATVSWTSPSSNGGAAITVYTVTSSGGQTCTTTGALTCIVTGLTNGTSYTFTVTATNSVGVSPLSAPSSAVTPATVPGAPTAIAATVGNASATVSWTAPSSNGGATITGYTVTSSAGQTCTTTGALTCTVTGLTNGTSYTFTVTATNAGGTSLISTASPAIIPLSSDFIYTGGTQSYTVPAGVYSINVAVDGASSGNTYANSQSGGAQVTGTIAVTPGEVLTIVVAGQGGNSTNVGGIGGYGGGGAGGSGGGGVGYTGSGGGGASQILNGSTELVIAGGGGGTGAGGWTGGAGGANGTAGGGNGGAWGDGGGGGTQTSGGLGGSGGVGTMNGAAGGNGSYLQGGAGSAYTASGGYGAGGGGGGYYGGGGGGAPGSSGYGAPGGGGGSSLVPSGGSASTGTYFGNGYVSIT